MILFIITVTTSLLKLNSVFKGNACHLVDIIDLESILSQKREKDEESCQPVLPDSSFVSLTSAFIAH